MKFMQFWDLTAFICSKVGDNYIAVKKAFVKKLDPWVQFGDWLYPVNLLNPTVEIANMRWFFLDSATMQTLPFIEIKEKLLDKSILDEIMHTKTARNLTIQTENPLHTTRGEKILYTGLGFLLCCVIFFILINQGVF
jgi:hypothetical protein